ncbi:CRISPR-associated ring nuclease Csm6 [Halomonas meridiana]|uniref:CRISPR-associated ring nuclease Csm6 n=1 Tax=Vreelandella aquamarina TaxID=77097 RepID=UPI00273CBFBE|nr:CRISPR-associated ring nuclease Csm6 [Halomonas meridiana]MDP4559154.1 CRISPR-associated ring nuclease Csm6 [Halomonas meridiana]
MSLTLLAVTGMTPQVITETLYGLHRQRSPWPSRLHIITTQVGQAILEKSLFADQKLAALCDELKMPRYRRDQVQIDVVPDAEGNTVDDARTLADHEALADFIMQTVRELTADTSTNLHASIAGGRKTMTFYLGYAMSLFGRPDDRMSHVLVSEGYENHPDFFFPTRTSQWIKDRDGREWDMAKADVSLADIPFIRQRDQLPNMLQQQGQPKGKRMSFRQLVELINLGAQPHRLAIRLDASSQKLDVLAEGETVHTLTFGGLFDWCWYEVVALATLHRDGSLRRHADDGEENTAYFGHAVMARLAVHLGLPYDTERDLRPQVEEWLCKHEDALEAARIRPVDFESSMLRGLNVSQVNNRIKRRLNAELPSGVALRLSPGLYFDDSGVKQTRTRKGGGYGLNIEPEQIIGLI